MYAVKGRFKSLVKLESTNLGHQNSFLIQTVIQSKRMDSLLNPDKFNVKPNFFQRLRLNLKRQRKSIYDLYNPILLNLRKFFVSSKKSAESLS